MSDRLEELKAALKGRYEIERELGHGGMATVYLAQDVERQREVAVKVLRPDLAAALGPERFLREIRIAANLTHPHILPLYDSGEAEGFLFYVMPYIKGQTLRDRIEKEGELPIAEAVRIIREVVDALAFAHSEGVVHRDIKPDNIMLTGGHAIVADFGVAKAVSEATGRDKLTTAGVALGTPAYMSPEQATADPHVDHRADIYAVGAMAYELLAGRTPFTGATPQSILAAHVTEQVEPVSKHRDHVSAELEALIMRCLEKKPADRWQSADEMLPHLDLVATSSGGLTPTHTQPVTGSKTSRWKPAAILIGALVVGAFGVSQMTSGSPGDGAPNEAVTEDTRPSVGVLAFIDRSSEGDNEYLADGMSEAIMDGLFNAGIRVAARTSSFSFKGSTDDIPTIASKLGVAYVMEGSLLRIGDQLRVSARLVNAQDGFPVWSDDYDGQFNDVFSFQDNVVGSIVNALQREFGEGSQAAPIRDAAGTTENSEAYDSYMLGRFFLAKRTYDGMSTSIAHFENAVALDSNFALAWVGLSDALNLVWLYSDPRTDSRSLLVRSELASQRALEIAPGLGEAYVSSASGSVARWRWNEAIETYERGLSLNPDYVTGHHWLSQALLISGDLDRAWEEAATARQLDPLSMIVGLDYTSVAAAVGRFEEAEAEHLSLLERFPDVARLHLDYGVFLLGRGNFDEGITHTLRGLEILGVALSPAVRDSLRNRSTMAITMSGLPVGRGLDDMHRAAYSGDWETVMDILDPPVDPLDYGTWPGWLSILGYQYPELVTEPRYGAALERMGLPVPSR